MNQRCAIRALSLAGCMLGSWLGFRHLNYHIHAVALALVMAGACTPQRPEHDLTVANDWVMHLTIQVSVEPLARQDQRSTLRVVVYRRDQNLLIGDSHRVRGKLTGI